MKQVEHDNILPFYGVSAGTLDFCLVFPWYNRGNNMEYLEENPTVDRYELASASKPTAYSQCLLEFREQLLGAVNGLRYLHSIRLVHGALQPVRRMPCLLKVFDAVSRVTYWSTTTAMLDWPWQAAAHLYRYPIARLLVIIPRWRKILNAAATRRRSTNGLKITVWKRSS